MSERGITEYSRNVLSEDWGTSLHAAETLGRIGTDEAIKPLVECLKSTDNWIRNAAALGLMETKNQKYFKPLLDRIIELGPNQEIGTLVYALTEFDCSAHLFDIAYLFLNGNFEVKNATTGILNDTVFQLTKNQLDNVNRLLIESGTSIEGFKIKYELTENANES